MQKDRVDKFQKIWLFLTIKVIENIQGESKFWDKHDHNISILCDGWENFSSNKSETKYDF